MRGAGSGGVGTGESAPRQQAPAESAATKALRNIEVKAKKVQAQRSETAISQLKQGGHLTNETPPTAKPGEAGDVLQELAGVQRLTIPVPKGSPLRPEGFPKSPSVQPRMQVAKETVDENARLENDARLAQAAEVAGNLTDVQQEAVLKAHNVGAGEQGKNGAAGVDNYTLGQLREKAKILGEAGLSAEQRRALMQNGIVGDPVPGAEPTGPTTPPPDAEPVAQPDRTTAPKPVDAYITDQIKNDNDARAKALAEGKPMKGESLQQLLDRVGYKEVLRDDQGRVLKDKDGKVVVREYDDIISKIHADRDARREENLDERQLRDKVLELDSKWAAHQTQEVRDQEQKVDAELASLANDTSEAATTRKGELQKEKDNLASKKSAFLANEAHARGHERKGPKKWIDDRAVWLADHAGDKKIKEHYRAWRGYRDLYREKLKEVTPEVLEIAHARNRPHLWLKKHAGFLFGGLTPEQKHEIDGLTKEASDIRTLLRRERKATIEKKSFQIILLLMFIIGPAALTILPAIATAKLFQMAGKAPGQ